MTKVVPPVPERVHAAFRKLSASAADLNAASNDLRSVISELDAALQKLNLGISCWVKISAGDLAGSTFWWSRDIGYARIENRWGIALREAKGDHNFPESDEVEKWLFNEAPRWLRIEGIAKIPDLLEKLTEQADSTTKRIKEKAEEAKLLAVAIKEAAD